MKFILARYAKEPYWYMECHRNQSDEGKIVIMDSTYMRFEILTALKIQIVIIWAMKPCNLVGGYQRTSQLGIINEKTIIRIVCSIQISNMCSP
jgi:hypothetical protein